METNSESRNLALVAHLAPLAGYFIAIGQIIIPLLIYLMTDKHFAKEQAKEALNAQISFTIYGVIAGVSVLFFVGFLLIPVLVIFVIWTMLSAAMAVSKGEPYRYPLIFRFIS